MRRRFMHCIAALFLCALAAGASRASEFELNYGHIQNPGHDLAVAPEYFKKIVEERTGGRVAISIFPSSQLGTAREMMEQCAMGTLDITFAGASDWASAINVPELAAFELPFLYNNLEAQKKLIDEILVAECTERLKGTGVRLLLTYSNGIRNPILKSKPIYTMDDLKGLKMRCPENPLFVDTWKYLGCNTVTSPWSEVYTVLSQGVADAAEADPVGLVNVNLQEVGKFYSRVAHMGSIYMVCINEDAWNGIPEDLQKIILECAVESETQQIKGRQKNDDIAEEALAKAGVKLNDLNEGERARMREAVKPIHDNFAKKHNLRELVDRLLALGE